MNWDRLREWIQTLGLVSIPIVVAVIGNAVAKSNATRETNAEYVRMAVDVLAHDSTHAARVWAVKVLARYSEVPFSAAAESAFAFADYSDYLGIEGGVPGLVISPNHATLFPGQWVRFYPRGAPIPGDSAALINMPGSVGWSATGGTIRRDGLWVARFTAGQDTGDFLVTATSSQGLKAVARVHIRPRPR